MSTGPKGVFSTEQRLDMSLDDLVKQSRKERKPIAKQGGKNKQQTGTQRQARAATSQVRGKTGRQDAVNARRGVQAAPKAQPQQQSRASAIRKKALTSARKPQQRALTIRRGGQEQQGRQQQPRVQARLQPRAQPRVQQQQKAQPQTQPPKLRVVIANSPAAKSPKPRQQQQPQQQQQRKQVRQIQAPRERTVRQRLGRGNGTEQQPRQRQRLAMDIERPRVQQITRAKQQRVQQQQVTKVAKRTLSDKFAGSPARGGRGGQQQQQQGQRRIVIKGRPSGNQGIQRRVTY